MSQRNPKISKVKVSVIIPVYNTEKYLSECMDSVLGQDLREIEIICINDGSADASLDILKKYAAADDRIFIIDQENRGLSEARNVGMNHAGGEYLFFLDSDDFIKSGELRRLYCLAVEKDLDILAFDAECLYETEELKRTALKDNYYQRKKAYLNVQTGRELFCDLVEDGCFCDAAWLMLIRRGWLQSSGIRFQPGLIHEDCLFSFQCYMRVKRISHINERPYIYRVRQDSIMTSGANYKSLFGRLFCYKEIVRYLMTENLSGRETGAVAKFAEFIMYNIKWTNYALENKEKSNAAIAGQDDRYEKEKREWDLEPVLQLFMSSMELGNAGRSMLNPAIYELGFKSLISSYGRIILYGAGKIGHMVFEYFVRNRMEKKIIGFAVSERRENADEICRVAIKPIWKYAANEDTLVLITARWDFQESMRKMAAQAGFLHIAVIDFRLEQILSGDNGEAYA